MGDKTENKSTEKQRTSKGFIYEVVLLDGEHVNFELDRNAEGRELFDKVCQHLDLIEKDYFGLQFVDERLSNHLKCWLSPDKKITKQKKGGPWLFDFALKFYPPDPTQLRESLTRWLVTLQTRRDILSGKLPATFLTQAMLGSYCVQADVGDYDPNEHRGVEYIRDTPFAPNQTTDLLEKIVELHRQHKGQTPDEAEINFLENAKKLSMYGVDLHAAQDVNNVDIMLGVCASGLQVYREKLRISRFVWPKILKISYKRKHFYIKVRPTDNSPTENTISFKLASHRLAKRLWKICVEHHAFFRLREAEQSQNAAMFPRLGSKFRYSGRTLYQTRQNSQILDRPDPYFERSQPARSTFAAPSNRCHSVDELSNRPDYWKDDMDMDRKHLPSDEKNRKDWKDDPNATDRTDRDNVRPLGSEDGGLLEPGANRSMDGKDRLDCIPGEDGATLNRGGEGTMGLTPVELQKKYKEDEKERKKREKEEEKRRKKEEEDRRKADKAAKKGKGKEDPSAEDRKDLMAGGDNTERVGWTPGSYGAQEGDRDMDKIHQGPDHGGQDGDRRMGLDLHIGRWTPETGQSGEGRNIYGPDRDGSIDFWRDSRGRLRDDNVGKDGQQAKERCVSDRNGQDQYHGRERNKGQWGSVKEKQTDKDRFASGRDEAKEWQKLGKRDNSKLRPGKEEKGHRQLTFGKDDVDDKEKYQTPVSVVLGAGRGEKDHKDSKGNKDKAKKNKGRKAHNIDKTSRDSKKDKNAKECGKKDKKKSKKGDLSCIRFMKAKDSKSKVPEDKTVSQHDLGNNGPGQDRQMSRKDACGEHRGHWEPGTGIDMEDRNISGLETMDGDKDHWNGERNREDENRLQDPNRIDEGRWQLEKDREQYTSSGDGQVQYPDRNKDKDCWGPRNRKDWRNLTSERDRLRHDPEKVHCMPGTAQDKEGRSVFCSDGDKYRWSSRGVCDSGVRLQDSNRRNQDGQQPGKEREEYTSSGDGQGDKDGCGPGNKDEGSFCFRKDGHDPLIGDNEPGTAQDREGKNAYGLDRWSGQGDGDKDHWSGTGNTDDGARLQDYNKGGKDGWRTGQERELCTSDGDKQDLYIDTDRDKNHWGPGRDKDRGRSVVGGDEDRGHLKHGKGEDGKWSLEKKREDSRQLVPGKDDAERNCWMPVDIILRAGQGKIGCRDSDSRDKKGKEDSERDKRKRDSNMDKTARAARKDGDAKGCGKKDKKKGKGLSCIKLKTAKDSKSKVSEEKTATQQGHDHDRLDKERSVMGTHENNQPRSCWELRTDQDMEGRNICDLGTYSDKDRWSDRRDGDDENRLQYSSIGDRQQTGKDKDRCVAIGDMRDQYPGRDGYKDQWGLEKDQDRGRFTQDREGYKDHQESKKREWERRTRPEREGQWTPGMEGEDPNSGGKRGWQMVKDREQYAGDGQNLYHGRNRGKDHWDSGKDGENKSRFSPGKGEDRDCQELGKRGNGKWSPGMERDNCRQLLSEEGSDAEEKHWPHGRFNVGDGQDKKGHKDFGDDRKKKVKERFKTDKGRKMFDKDQKNRDKEKENDADKHDKKDKDKMSGLSCFKFKKASNSKSRIVGDNVASQWHPGHDRCDMKRRSKRTDEHDSHRGHWVPATDQDRWGGHRDDDRGKLQNSNRNNQNKQRPGKYEQCVFDKERDKYCWDPESDEEDWDRFISGRGSNKDHLEPGRDGDWKKTGPDTEGLLSPAPRKEVTEAEQNRWAPGRMLSGLGPDDRDPSKKGLRYKKDKKGKKNPKKVTDTKRSHEKNDGQCKRLQKEEDQKGKDKDKKEVFLGKFKKLVNSKAEELEFKAASHQDPNNDRPDKNRLVSGKDGHDEHRGHWELGTGQDRDERDFCSPSKDGDKDSSSSGRNRLQDSNEEDKNGWQIGQDRDQYAVDGNEQDLCTGRDKDHCRFGKKSEERHRSHPSQDGDQDSVESGKNSDLERKTGPGKDRQFSPGNAGEDHRRMVLGKDDVAYRNRWVQGGVSLRAGSDETDPSKRDYKYSDEDRVKKGKKDWRKVIDRQISDEDNNRQRKRSEKEESKKNKGKKERDKKKDKDADKRGKMDKDKKGLFGKFKKSKDSKSKMADEEIASHMSTSRGNKGSAYPGYGPGMGMGAGDMSGVVGEETWIDNKLTFEPIVPPKKETKDSLKSGIQGIDHTMPFFSPAATSTVGRPSKVPPPVPPKANSFDDSFNRTDVYKNDTDGIQETRVEHKMVLSSADDEDFDYDAALADAIRSVTEFNPDMSVERIECVQQIEEVKSK